MRLLIITSDNEYSFSSEYIKYLYPTDKMFDTCVELREQIAQSEFENKSISMNSLSGPLKQLPNALNGQKRLNNLRNILDQSQSIRSTKETDRLHWQGRGIVPARKTSSLSPIYPSSTMSGGMKVNASKAMALGVILQKGRAMMLYDIVRQNTEALARKVASENPGSVGCIFILVIKYLKVAREYGKAPQLSKITLDKIISAQDDEQYFAVRYISNKVKTVCHDSIKALPNTEYSKEFGEVGDSDGTAVLFIKCLW